MNRDLPNPTARPPLRVPRISIGQTMAVVAACAALGQESPDAFTRALFVGIWLVVPVWFAVGIGKALGERRGTALALTAGAAVVLGYVLVRPHSGPEAFVVVVLTVANGLGPFVAADRFLRSKPLTSGHLLWAWAGCVYSVSLFSVHSHRHGGAFYLVLGCARLLLAAVVLLLAFARRPAGTDGARTHLAGWLIVECDVIVWGCLVARHQGWS